MIVWINGPFGAGKTTLATALDERDDVSVVDTERAGGFLEPYLAPRKPVANFQDWRAWRILAAAMVRSLHEEIDGLVVVPQSVFVESYWDELLAGIGAPVTAITLDVQRGELERRIRGDRVEANALEWRLEQAELYERARPWLGERTHLVDTTSLSPDQVAAEVLRLVT